MRSRFWPAGKSALPRPSGDPVQDARARLERFRKADATIDLGAGGLTGSPGALKLTPDESERALETMRHLVEQQIEDYMVRCTHPVSEE